ncbi:LYSMD4 isoform 3 [Pongo abelii]|uniref:LYSMD4 isoform 3 n=1 Tax=Pongo abelii TaxID=9601 RepID=A0A2J8VXQ8_PONAB|nr:LYSMD4 isoform 3 [Pongo abelii]
MDSIHPQRCACNSQIRPRWDCVARCFLRAPGLPSRDDLGAHKGEASGGAGTVSLTLSQPRERDLQVKKVFVKGMKKERALGEGAAWWQSQRLVSPGKHDRVSMHSKSQSVFTGVSARDKQFTTTFSIVFTI